MFALTMTIFGILFLGLVFVSWMLFRNERVYEFRTKHGEAIHAENMRDIDNRECDLLNPRWKWHDSVTYEDMALYRFWKPLDSFYEPFEEWLEKQDKESANAAN